MSISTTYYVRSDGRIKGPYPLSVLSSMLMRGRIDHSAEVSPDRRTWEPLAQLGSGFSVDTPPAATVGAASARTGEVCNESDPSPQEFLVGSTHVIPLAAAFSPTVMCFFSVDGVMQGPIPLPHLQQRATAGILAPTDPVWLEGQPEWCAAGLVPGLTFPNRKSRLKSWFLQKPALATSLILFLTVVLVGPIALVIGLARSRETQQAVAEQARREAIARVNADIKDLRDREDKMLLAKAEMEDRSERMRLEYTMIAANKAQAEETQRRMDALGTELQSLRQNLDENHAEQMAATSAKGRLSEAQGSEFNGKFQIGDKVANTGITRKWSGRVIDIRGGLYEVEFSYVISDLRSKYGIGDRHFFSEGEITPRKSMSILEFFDK